MAACYSLIPAAGVGARMAASRPKQYLQVAGKPVLRHVLDTFAATAAIAHSFVVVSPDDGMIEDMMAQAPHLAQAGTILRVGGPTRRDSVRNGLEAMRSLVADDDWVLVHDAARPGLTVALVEHLIAELADDAVGGLLALPVVDTLKRASADGRSAGTVPRDGLWTAQTPQMFRYAVLWQALGLPGEFTDEASAIEGLGLQPKLVMGSARNFKLTMAADVALAGLYLDVS
ncbi:MAG: 2-C-methyl-D-erythritol 4-phosphate cytidylyltransferase [Herminiimonas sp.]|nr:2-C-methyl-D-erythritol 4-phosphate cytidylyltransferase [Herminiimonas sp.]